MRFIILVLSILLVVAGYMLSSQSVDVNKLLGPLAGNFSMFDPPKIFVRKQSDGEEVKLFKLKEDTLIIEAINFGQNLYHCEEYISLNKKVTTEGQCSYIENYKPVSRSWKYVEKSGWVHRLRLVNSYSYRKKGYFKVFLWVPFQKHKPIPTEWLTIY